MKRVIDSKEYVQCEVCRKFATLDNAAKLGWDWFTGYLQRTHHYCKQHSDSPQRNEAFRLRMQKPANKETP